MENNHICSFCGKQSDKLIFGDYGSICPDCAKLVTRLEDENFVEHTHIENTEIPTPIEMKKFLDQFQHLLF